MALEAGGSPIAEPTTLPTDVALAWASLERAKAVLWRLENGLEGHPGMWRSRRLEGIRSGVAEPSRDMDAAISKDPQARESPSSSCRLEGDFLKRHDVTWPFSPTAGCLPTGRDSDSRRTRPPYTQQEPCLAMPALTLSGPSLEGVEEQAPGLLPLSFAGPAIGLEKKASHRQAASPPTSAPPVLGNCCLAWQLEGLKENSPEEQKLQALKARIREQRKLHLSRHLLRGRRSDLGSFGEGSLGRQQPLKRKVCKLVVAAATAAVESLGHQGRAPRMRKRPGPSNAAHVPGKDWKERAAHPFGASAWREGQRLTRKILGPLLEPPKQRSSLEEQMVAPGTGAEPCQVMSAPSQVEERSRQSKVDKAQWTTAMIGAGQAWDVHPGRHSKHPKGQDLGTEADQRSRAVSRKDMAGPDPGSDIVQSTRLSEVLDVPARDPGRSSQRSNPLYSPTSGKENQVNGNRWVGCKRHPYSPEEVQEFMIKKMAERKKKTREAKWASDQAWEARRRRLQEVYRKQRVAVSRKRSRVEDPQMVEGGTLVTLGKQDHNTGQGHVNDGPPDTVARIQQALDVLLRIEPQGSSRSSPKTAGRVKTPDSPSSPAPKGGLGSPLQLTDLATRSPLPQCSPPQSPFLLPSRPLEALTPTGPSDLSLHRSTRDRVRAVESLAQELSARVESAMARLRMAERPVDGGKAGSPALTGRVFGPKSPREALEAGVLPKSIYRCPFPSPSTEVPLSQLGTSDEEGATTKGELCSFLAGTMALPGQPSSEEKPCAVCTRGLKEMQEGGASVPEFLTAQVLTPEKARTGSSKPATLFVTERADPYIAPCQNSRVKNHQEKQLDIPDLEKTPEVGVHPGRCFQRQPFHQRDTLDLSLPIEKLTHRKAIFPEESGDESEVTSQWSEVDLFYGSSGTFCHFGLTMAEQSFREEELSARHQSALLRLREQALQERVRAELAWMEHRIRLQGADDESVAVEKQDKVVTSLNQEQAEIRHLQNVCRAAHQRRKLLLKQHKELLQVQESTARLWQQIFPRGGTLQHRADARTPTSFEGTVVPEKEESAKASSPMLDITTCSGARNSSGLQATDNNNIHTERAEMSSPRIEAAGRCPKQKSRPEVMVENLHPCRGQATSPPPWDGSMMGTADREEEGHKEDPGPKDPKEDPGPEDPKEDQCHASFNKEPAPHMSLGSLASEEPFDASCCSSPEMGSLCLDSEFHKAHAVLVNISGSSPSTSNLEAEATDVSLPEEFVFQESSHESCSSDLSGPPLPLDPEDPRVVTCDDSQVDSPVLHGHEKPLDDTGTYRCDAAVLVHGMQRSNSPCAGESLFLQADVTPDGSLNTLALLPCADNIRGNDMAIQGWSQSATGTLVENQRITESEIQRKQSPTSPVGRAERDAIGQHRSYPDTDIWPTEYLHEVSSKDRDSINNPVQDVVLLPGDQIQPFQSLASIDLSVPDPAPSVPDPGKEFQSLNSKKSQVFVGNELVPGMEGDIRSPVDEVLTYGSADLPSPDASISSDDLPAPPEDLCERDESSSCSTLGDFPSPPDELLFPETGEPE